MVLLNTVRTFWKEFYERPQTGVFDKQKVQSNIVKHGIRMAMLVLVLVRSVNYEIIKIRKKSKAKYLEIKKNAKRAV